MNNFIGTLVIVMLIITNMILILIYYRQPNNSIIHPTEMADGCTQDKKCLKRVIVTELMSSGNYGDAVKLLCADPTIIPKPSFCSTLPNSEK